MNVDIETIEKEILGMLSGKLKRSVKPRDLVQEVAAKLDLEDQKPVWAAVKSLQLKQLIHEEKYLEAGKGYIPKTVKPEKVTELAGQILEALESNDYCDPKELQTELGADFANFKAAQDKLKLEGKIRFTKDPSLGWLLCKATARQVTQRPVATKATPSKPAASGANNDEEWF